MAELEDLGAEKRNGGCGVIFEGKFYLWGGQSTVKRRLSDSDDEDDEEDDSDEELEVPVDLPNHETHPFSVLDTQTGQWSGEPTGGSPPLLGLGSSLDVHPKSRSFFLYGGWNDHNFSSDVYRIFVGEWIWEIIRPATSVVPSPRYLTGSIVHKNALCVFGGVGPNIVAGQDKGADYFEYFQKNIGTGFGWNNEYYEFDIAQRTWTAPLGEDAKRPEPVGGFSLTKFNPHQALIFGGRTQRGRVNTAFILDLERREFQGPLEPSGPEQPWPRERSFPTLTPLVDPEMVGERLCGCGPVVKQRTLLLWGKYTDDDICNEAWVLDMETFTWKQVNTGLVPRSWHVAEALYSCQGSSECRVFVFGGNVHSRGLSGERVDTADLRILQFGVPSLMNSCLSVIVGSEELRQRADSQPHRIQTQIHRALNLSSFLCDSVTYM